MSASNNEKKIKKYHEYVFNIQNDFSVSLYDAEKIVETIICTNTISTIEDVMKFYNNQRDRNSAKIKQKPISELEQWNISDQIISHSSKNFFEVYDNVQLHLKKDDINYIIYSVGGRKIYYDHDIENC